MRFLRVAAGTHRWMPSKNGGGVTLEVGDALIAEGASHVGVHPAPAGHASLLVARLWRGDSAMPDLSHRSG